MGDRGNIVIRPTADTNQEDIWLYTHWSGSDLAEILARAMARRQRWTDAAYLARIIFCEMIGKDGLDKETGFGIATYQCDNEHDRLVVDVTNQTICSVAEPRGVRKGPVRLPDGLLTAKDCVAVWTFEEFLAKFSPSPAK